jgi:hypothetical protein
MGKTRKGTEDKAIELCKAGDFVNAIAELVAAREHVTFVEMERLLSPYMDTQGSVTASSLLTFNNKCYYKV